MLYSVVEPAVREAPTAMLSQQLQRAITQAVAILQGGGVVAFPTDTLYGLGASIFSTEGVRRVFQIKRRGAYQALPVLLSGLGDLGQVALEVPELAWKLAARFWPGPLTLVVRKAATVPGLLTGGKETLAVRVPDHPVPIALIRQLGTPITGTSANRSGGPAPRTAAGVRRQLGDAVELVIDGGTTPGDLPSTIVEVTGPVAQVLRVGALPLERLHDLLQNALEVVRGQEGARA
ncbi:MAG: L-threonylcarbamoyladenylate synthase [Dehalococcoidia bacterium]